MEAFRLIWPRSGVLFLQKPSNLGIGDMSGCFFFQIKKDPDKTTADGGAGDISGFQKIRKLGKTFILVPVF